MMLLLHALPRRPWLRGQHGPAAAPSHPGRPSCRWHAQPPPSSSRRRALWRPAAAAADNPPPPGLSLPFPFNPYEDLVRGKKFVCTECGKCCTGAGEVWVNEEECARIASHLGLSAKHFQSRYTKSYSKRPGWRLLKRAAGSQACVFLVDNKCSIHGVKPLQCITYPWWPELMEPAAWLAERATVCEGISHETAQQVDPVEKGEMLRLATEQLAALQAAAVAGRRRGGGGSAQPGNSEGDPPNPRRP